jgi:hypothetical protein
MSNDHKDLTNRDALTALATRIREIAERYPMLSIHDGEDELTAIADELDTLAHSITLRKDAQMNLPDLEIVSAKVHEAWIASKAAQGVTSRKAEDGEELIAPYGQLSEKAKELDRGTVRAVYAAIRAAGGD